MTNKRRGVDRRKVLLGGGAAVAGTLASTVPSGPATATAPRRRPTSTAGRQRPNIVVIYLDDLGYGDFSCYGSTMINTPQIDAFAEEGTRYTQAYAGATVCTPSRAALLTGRVPPRVGLPHVLQPDADIGLPASERTIAEYLSDAGYATTCIGKWHLGDREEFRPTRHGFDHFFGALYSNDMEPFELWRDNEVIEEEVDQSTLTRRYTDEAIKAIDDAGDQPFFIYLPETMPHLPLSVEDEFAGQSDAGIYGDVVESLDHHLGRLFEALRSRDVYNDTLVILTSDNGPWFDGSAGGLRGRKIDTYEGALRVPFIVRWPGVVPAGDTREEPLSVLDLLPTLCAYAGVDPDSDVQLDGTDIRPLFQGGELSEHPPIYYFDDQDGRLNAVRDGRWKLHVKREDETERRLPDLYDLERDSTESYNLADRHPDVVKRLRDIIDDMEAELPAPN